MKPPVKSLLTAVLTLSGAGSLQPQTAADQPAGASPLLVSPGGRGREGLVGTGCPTFSWADTPQAAGYTLIVYEVASSQEGESPREPLLRAEFPAGVSSWTPDLNECLPTGRYGWAVAAIDKATGAEQILRWSKPAVFRVEETPVGRDRERPERAAAALDGAATPPLPQSSSPSGVAPEGSPFRSMTGEALFLPPGCSAGSEKFLDVPASSPFCRWVEQIASYGVINGCGGGRYCPGQPVTREQLAVFLTRAMRGTLNFAPAPGGARAATVDDPAASDVGEHTSIAIGADGLPVISYYDSSAQALKVAHCNDVACDGAGETITTVDDPANIVGLYTSIAIGADGLPVISYRDSIAQSLKVAHCNDVACAPGGEVITTVDEGANNIGPYTSIAIGTDGLPVISYQDFTAGTLKVTHCNDLACAGMNETISTVDDPPTQVGSYTSIAIGADGFPIISYRGDSAQSLKVAHCNDVACAGATITTVDDTVNSLGLYTSVAIGADGLPVISYYDETARNLKVAHCNDVACAGMNETITTVDALDNNVGAFTSLAIGADGLPIISYFYSLPASALRVAHCNDVACAGLNETITTVDDPVNIVGRYNSLVIGSDGVPIISYYDQTAGALKVLHCGTLSCTQ